MTIIKHSNQRVGVLIDAQNLYHSAQNLYGKRVNLGIETKSKDLQIFHGGAKKADWDVGIAMDAVKLAPHLDAIVIASGDGDFIPMVEYVQQNAGCQVEVISFGRSSSSKLMDAADDFTDMCDDTKRYLMHSRVARSHNKRKRQASNTKRPLTKKTTNTVNKTNQKKTATDLLPPVKKTETPKKKVVKKATPVKKTAKTVKNTAKPKRAPAKKKENK